MNQSDANATTVFFFDVDNTLLDNDHVSKDLKQHLINKVGEFSAGRYWEIFEQLRGKLGYADYLGALQQYRIEHPHDLSLLAVSHFMINYPFANRLFPESIDAVAHAQRLGIAAIMSDGDVVFQPRKIERSGLHEAFGDNILIYIHKELELGDVEAKYPAKHYVMVDDKVRILAALKRHWGARVTTVFPRQATTRSMRRKWRSIRRRISRSSGSASCRSIRWKKSWRQLETEYRLVGFFF